LTAQLACIRSNRFQKVAATGFFAKAGAAVHNARRVIRAARPTRRFLVTAAAIVLTGLTLLGALIVWGYLQHDWPAYYLQDDQPGTWLSGGGLWIAGLLLILKSIRSVGSRRWFWFLGGLTLLVAAGDDMLRWHERFEIWAHAQLGADVKHPVTGRLNDVLVMGYGMLALWYSWRHRRCLLAAPAAVVCFALAGPFFALMVLLDFARASQTVEESAKTLAVLLILVGCLSTLMQRRRRGRSRTLGGIRWDTHLLRAKIAPSRGQRSGELTIPDSAVA
jgi:hypothetical protein